jgi:hypothetical protein
MGYTKFACHPYGANPCFSLSSINMPRLQRCSGAASRIEPPEDVSAKRQESDTDFPYNKTRPLERVTI